MTFRLSRSVLATYNRAKQWMLNVCGRTQKEALMRHAEELKAQLHMAEEHSEMVEEHSEMVEEHSEMVEEHSEMAEEHSLSLEQQITKLSENLEAERNENESLWDQVEYLTNNLHSQRAWGEATKDLHRRMIANFSEEKRQWLETEQQLMERAKEQAHEKDLLVKKEMKTRNELEMLRVFYQKVLQSYDFLQQQHDMEKASLMKQVQHLTSELHSEQAWGEEMKALHHRMIANFSEEKRQWLETEQQLTEREKEQAREKDLLVKKEKKTRNKLVMLKSSHQKLLQSYDSLQQRPDKEMRSLNERASEKREQIQRLKTDEDEKVQVSEESPEKKKQLSLQTQTRHFPRRMKKKQRN